MRSRREHQVVPNPPVAQGASSAHTPREHAVDGGMVTFTEPMSEADYEAVKALWLALHGKPGTAHLLIDQRIRADNAEERLRLAREALARDGYFTADEIGDDIAPRLVEWLSHHRDRASEAETDLAWQQSVNSDLRVENQARGEKLARVRELRDTWLVMTLEPGQVRRLLDEITHALDGPADPLVQCWHYEPGSPCDWNVCRQPERRASGDYGTDPARGVPVPHPTEEPQ